jgi:1-acyl-sn-glycerol-3-phosphate acyltransferase
MKYIATLYIWIIGGLLFGLSFILIIVLNPFFKQEKLFDIIIFLSKFILKILFFKIDIVYEQEIDKNVPHIFMPNHVSMIDVLVMAAYQPVHYNAIEAESHFKWFLYGKVIKILGQIPIDRKNKVKSIESFKIAKERLKTGRSIIVFPEGTRSKSGQLGEFKNMPFRFAKDSEVGLIPVAIIGVDKIAPEKSIWIKPARITIVFGKEIKQDEIRMLNYEQLKEKVRNEIIRMKKKYA